MPYATFKAVTFSFLALSFVGFSANAQPSRVNRSSHPAAIASPTPTPTPKPVILAPAPADFGDMSDFSTALSTALKPGARVVIGSTTVAQSLVQNIYEPKAYQPLFVDQKGLNTQGVSLRQILTEGTVADGLNAADYWTNDIAARVTSTSPRALLELDLLLTKSLIQYASDLYTGRTNPQDDSQNISDIELGKRTLKNFDQLVVAVSAADQTQMAQAIQTYAPTHPAYAKLKAELGRLFDVKARGGFAPLKFKKSISANGSDANVTAIRQRLVDLGALSADQASNTSSVYDSQMVQAVSILQESEKVAVTPGALGKSTYATLNMSVDVRINQTRANLERWRLMPRSLGSRYIFVNLGDQTFKLYDGSSEPVMSMRVVIGQELRETPTFVDQINEVEVNPFWNAPAGIIVKDVLPKAERDPHYFSEMRIRVFENGREIDPESVDWSRYNLQNKPPFSFREEPGPNNSLGLVKFNLSMNHHDIYMHDTNHRELFAQEKRQYSSGCIRLQHPFDLANYLLNPIGISNDELQAMTQDPSIRAKYISVPQPLRVYVIGTTISVSDELNTVYFGPDIYNQDERIVNALNGVATAPGAQHAVGNAAP